MIKESFELGQLVESVDLEDGRIGIIMNGTRPEQGERNWQVLWSDGQGEEYLDRYLQQVDAQTSKKWDPDKAALLRLLRTERWEHQSTKGAYRTVAKEGERIAKENEKLEYRIEALKETLREEMKNNATRSEQ